MATAVQWLTSDSSKKHRVYDVFGTDAVMRSEVLTSIEARINAESRVSLSAAESSSEAIWQTLSTAPLSGVTSRLVVVSDATRIRSWSGLDSFISDRASYTETTLVLVSDREEAGHRVRTPDPRIRGKFNWATELYEWEQSIRAYAAGAAIQCSVPSIEPSGTDKLSPVARWLSLRVRMDQRQAEHLWSRAGHQTALARDVCDQMIMLGVIDVRYTGLSEFRTLVNSLLTLHGPDDFAELLLFGRRDLALAALSDHAFSASDWSRVLGFLSQRLDWLSQLHVALATDERLDQVERRCGIHRKFILHYAHREDPSHNIARRYDRARVLRCRQLLGDLDAELSRSVSIPPAFGEALLAAW